MSDAMDRWLEMQLDDTSPIEVQQSLAVPQTFALSKPLSLGPDLKTQPESSSQVEAGTDSRPSSRIPKSTQVPAKPRSQRTRGPDAAAWSARATFAEPFPRLAKPHWTAHVREPLRHVRAARGALRRNAIVGSAFLWIARRKANG